MDDQRPRCTYCDTWLYPEREDVVPLHGEGCPHWVAEPWRQTPPQKNAVGRPQIGQPINIRLGDDLLGRVDGYASTAGQTRAEAIRSLLTSALPVRPNASIHSGDFQGILDAHRQTHEGNCARCTQESGRDVPCTPEHVANLLLTVTPET